MAGNEGGAAGLGQPHAQCLALASVRPPYQERLQMDRAGGSGPARFLPPSNGKSQGAGARLTPGGSVLSTCSAAAALARSCSHTGRVSSRRSRRLTVRPGRWGPPACPPPASGTSYSGSWAGLGQAPDLSRGPGLGPLPNPSPCPCPRTDCSAVHPCPTRQPFQLH